MKRRGSIDRSAPRARGIRWSSGARTTLRTLRPNTRTHVETVVAGLAVHPEVGLPLYGPLEALRSLRVSPGVRLVYLFSTTHVSIVSLHVAPPLVGHATPRFGAVILAAGSGTCCGAPQQLFPVETGPSVVASVDSFLAGAVHSLVLVLGYQAPSVRRAMSALQRPAASTFPGRGPDRVTLTLNERFDRPMRHSLQAGLRVIDPGVDALLVGLGNRPLVRPATIAAMMAAFERERPLAIRARFRDQPGHPVLFDASLTKELLALSGTSSVRTVLDRHATDVLDVEFDDPGIVTDVRTLCRQSSDRTGRATP